MAGAKTGVVVPWTILAFLAGALWGAELAVSIVFTVLMPDSGWPLGVVGPPLVAFVLFGVAFG